MRGVKYVPRILWFLLLVGGIGAYAALYSPVTKRIDPRLAGLLLLLAAAGVGAIGRRGRWFRVVLTVLVAGVYSWWVYASYSREPVTFSNGEVTLHGTVLRPRGDGPFPAMLFVHGSGRQTRAPFLGLAHVFARDNILCLIYDKRGSGASSGDLDAASYEDLATDALAGVALLRSRPDVDPARVGLWGFSEGCWVGSLAVKRSRDLAFFLGVSGGGVTPLDARRHQLGSRAPAAESDELFGAVQSYFAGQAKGREGLAAALSKYRDKSWFPETRMPGSVEGFDALRGWQRQLGFDPVARFDARPLLPKLLLFGELDPVMPSEESARNLGYALDGHRDSTVSVIAGGDHAMAWFGLGVRWPVYTPGYLSTMREWLAERCRPGDR